MPIIRFATAADASDIAIIYAPAVRDRATSFELDPPDAAEMAQRIARSVRTPWLVCEHKGRVIGYAYASTHRDRAAYQWSVEVSAYIHENHHRQGIGRGLYASLFALLVLQGFRNAYAGATLPNDSSVALHEAVGFTALGVFHQIGYKHGHWHDVVWFERTLASHDAEPALPIPITTLCAEKQYDDLIRDALSTGIPLMHVA